MAALRETLRHTFGFSSFRPHQEEVVDAILAGKDVFAALPTGGGKSLCYQLPSLVVPGLTVVVSPLIALMQDQVDGARQNGLAAAFLNSSLDAAAAAEVWRGLATRRIRLLYVSPERLALEDFRERLRAMDVSLFAIDEAHCISEWGHEFRPDYRSLGSLRGEFSATPIAAFTATATRNVQDDVIRLLGLRDPMAVRGDFDRREIFYRVERKTKVTEQIVRFVLAHRGDAGIVYRATRKSVEQTAAALVRRGVVAAPYHAGLSDEERHRHQDAFVRDEVQVIVATIAFGMGIDKSNVRWVVHGDLPRSLEAYYQETGRCGRDGEAAEACLFYGPQDLATIRYHIDRMEVDAERERATANLRGMVRYVNSGVCRRIQLLAHFDQEHPGECGGCDVCADGVEHVDYSVPAQKAMSAMVRTGERFGAHHIADVVSGVRTERVAQFGHDSLPTFGVGSDRPREWWLDLIGDLEAAGLVRRRDGAQSGLAIAEAGRRVLFGKQVFVTVERASSAGGSRAGARPDGLSHAGERTRRRGNDRAAGRAAAGSGAASAAGSGAPRAAAEDRAPQADDEELFQCLRAVRRRVAKEQGVPPYLVFSDKSLRSMVELRPTDEWGFLTVNGVGDRKAELYASAFIKAISEFAASGSCPG